LDYLKKQFDKNEKAMIQVIAKHWELIFFLFACPKCDLGEVVKAMFQGDACHFELILVLLANTKCDLGEF